MSLQCKGKVVQKLVHVLVAETYLENPENKPCVNHINGVKIDNRLENLEWVTCKENAQHAQKIGLLPTRKGVKHPNTKLTEKEVLKIYKLAHEKRLTQKEISSIMNINRHVVSSIKTGRTWNHITKHN